MTHQEYESYLSRIEQLIHVDFTKPSDELEELMDIAEQVWEYEETIYGNQSLPDRN